MSNRLDVTGYRLRDADNIKTPQRRRERKAGLIGYKKLSKGIFATTIEVFSVKRRAKVILSLLQPLRTLRLCGEKQVFNLGITISNLHGKQHLSPLTHE